MADLTGKTILELPESTSSEDTDVFVISKLGQTMRTALSTIKAKILANPILKWSLGTNTDPSTGPNLKLAQFDTGNGNMEVDLVYTDANNAGKRMRLIGASGNKLFSGNLRVSTKTVTLSSGASFVALSAPAVGGYEFLCWLGASSSGWIGLTYIENMTESSTYVWSNDSSSSSRNVVCTALYRVLDIDL